jgi:hypothetical protein
MARPFDLAAYGYAGPVNRRRRSLGRPRRLRRSR